MLLKQIPSTSMSQARAGGTPNEEKHDSRREWDRGHDYRGNDWGSGEEQGEPGAKSDEPVEERPGEEQYASKRRRFEYEGDDRDSDEEQGEATVDDIHPRLSLPEWWAALDDVEKETFLKDKGLPPGVRWTKINRKLVSPRALEEAYECFEERPGYVIVLRALTRDEIQKFGDRTREIRGQSRE
jgi:hypothetical protein